jgi:hypothetical protein
MSAENEGPAAFQQELSQVHRLLQQILSLVLSRLKSDNPIVSKIADRLYEKLSSVLTPSLPLSLHRRSGGFYLGQLPLPNSFVLRKLFESSRCSGVYFETGLTLEELREFLREVTYCLQHGVPPFPVVGETRHYHWITQFDAPTASSDLSSANLVPV